MPESLIGFQSYESRSLPYSAQRLVNLYFEVGNEGTKTPGVLFRRPGLELLTTLASSPIRGLHTMGDVVFIVAGTLVYTMDQSGTATVLPGNVLGTDLVDMDDNGDQVAIVAGELGYIATTIEVVQIVHEGFRLVSSVVYMDGYFIWTEAYSARVFISALFDGIGPYDTLDFSTAEYGPDDAVKVFTDHDDLFVMGTRTVEAWRNTGNVDFPYEPIPGTTMEVGLIARNTVQKIDNSIIWFGRDERGGVTVWRADGYTPMRVSTHALESVWDESLALEQAYAMTMRIEGHAFYILTIPHEGTWAYDASTQKWGEWQTKGRADWNIVGFGASFGKRIVGDRETGDIYTVSVQNYDDAGTSIVWEATSPAIASPNNSLARHNHVRVDAGTGVGLTNGGDPQIWIQWADEDGERFNSPKLMSLGARGKSRTRCQVRRLGQARSRTYRLSGDDPVALSLIGAYVDVEPGAY
jgi:hypothetical protein